MKFHRFCLPLLSLGLSAGFVQQATAAEGLRKLKVTDAARLVSIDSEANKPAEEGQLITERYADGKTKIERYVIRDLANNEINHGSWKKYDEAGDLIVEGHYRDGLRHGIWNAWYRARQAALFDQQPFRQFEGPFISQANFVDGKLDGMWTMYDRKQRKISQWQYSAGQRHGEWLWWQPTGKKLQRMTYKHGVADGMIQKFDEAGNIVSSERLEDGRLLDEETKRFANGKIKSKVNYLRARRVPDGEDHWAKLSLADYKSEGKDIKHGPSETWYANGQQRQKSQYDHGVETGEFTWWHQNGQVALDGKYADGRRDGLWTWWYENGQKSIEGNFVAGAAVEHWVYWNQDGKVHREATFTRAAGGVVKAHNSGDKTAELPDEPKHSSRRKTTWR